MGLFDFLKPADREAFEPTTTPPEEPRGGSGRYHTDGFLQVDELNTDLQGRAGLQTFWRMWASDPDVRKALTMCIVPIVSATWTTEPYTDDDETEPTAKDEELAEFVQWNLTEAMRPGLTSHLMTALTVAGRDGFAPFETLYRTATWNGRQVYALDTLDLRLPRSVDRWVQAGHHLVGIEQHAPGTVYNGDKPQVWARAQIPATDLLYYRFGAEGDNWEGQSLLRPAYKNWKYKEGLELIEAIGHERTAIGVPTGYAPDDADADDLDAFEEFLRNVRASESSYFLAPGPKAEYSDPGQGWHWEFVSPGKTEGAGRALGDTLSRHRDAIAASVVSEFMRLGQNGEGARATADVQQDPFWMLADTLAQIVVADAINEQLIPRLVLYNFGEAALERLPKVKCELIDSTSLTELASFIGQLAAVNAIRVEPTLEAYLRKVADLPEADEEAIEERERKAMEIAQAAKPAPGDDAKSKGGPVGKGDEKPSTLALGRQDRQLRPYETWMQLDRIESSIDGARERLQSAGAQQVAELAGHLAHQAAKAPVAHSAPPTQLTHLIHQELLSLYATGRDTVRQELAAQTPDSAAWLATLAEDTPEEPPASLLERATAAAGAIHAAAVSAVNTALATGEQAIAALATAAQQAAQGALRAAAMEHAAPALNTGRIAEADNQAEDIAGTYYTSILDGRRCDACRRADDDVLRPLSDPVRLAHVPPNKGCQGGGKCRCLEAYVLKTEAAPAA